MSRGRPSLSVVADADKAMRAAAEFAAVMGLAPGGILFTANDKVVKVNEAAALMLGYTNEEVVGLPFVPSFISEEFFSGVVGNMRSAFEQKAPFRTETQIRRKDGSRFWGRVVGYGVDHAQAGNDAIWFVDDFSEDRLMLDALDQSMRELVAIFDTVQIGIVVIRGARVARCNRHAERMLGYEPGALPGEPAQRFMEVDYGVESGRIEMDAAGAVADGFAAFGDQRLRRRDGSTFWGRLTGRPLDPVCPGAASVWILEDVTERHEAEQALLHARDELERRVWERTMELVDSNTRLLGEISERKHTEQRVWHMAHHDVLTGLPNRSLLLDRLTQALANAERGKHRVAVMFIDLDRFKGINDSLGHAIGDQLLQQVATRLSDSVRNVDTVSRLGGDEFVIVLQEVHERESILIVIDKIIETLARTMTVSGLNLTVTSSIGVSVFPEDGADATQLMRNADTAMYKAKARGRNTFQFFMAWMNDEATRFFKLENKLRNAVDRRLLEIHYQPQIDLNRGSVCGMEALLRWNDPEHGQIAPAEFIPIAEETGMILQVGEWVLHEAMRQNAIWQQQGLPALPVAVNLSPRQFRDKDLVNTVRAVLKETGQPPALLELEITESALAQDIDEILSKLNELASLGVRLSIDDFGTGYSSLSYLQRFPVHKLKVDRSFVRNVCEDSDSAAIVAAIIGLARILNLEILAEGVETTEQLDMLRAHGCHLFQGFYFSRPLPLSESAAIFQPAQLAIDQPH